MYEIEKNVPMPQSKGGRYTKYPWPDMEVGDSVSFPLKDLAKIVNTAHAWGRRHGKKFTTRRDENGVRVWRIE